MQFTFIWTLPVQENRKKKRSAEANRLSSGDFVKTRDKILFCRMSFCKFGEV